MNPNLHGSAWSGFYKKTLKERQNQLKITFPDLFDPPSPATSIAPSVSPVSSVYSTPLTSICSSPISREYSEENKSNDTLNGINNEQFNYLIKKLESLNIDQDPFPIKGLDEHIADKMIENCVGTIGLPVGLALNFIINEKPIIIPMAVEEPSVIAAVSGAAKTISSYKGFTAVAPERNSIIAQVVLLDIPQNSLNLAVNKFCANMVKRGGGVFDMSVRRISRTNNRNKKHHPISSENFREWLVVHLHIDVCDAMGANCASTVAEGVAPHLSELTGGRIGLRILSNLNVERMTRASFRIPLSLLSYKSYTGKEVAARIIEAYEWAEIDHYRAITHNKGIMNGIDSVALAAGQDWRAIEASAHAWACDGVRGDYSQSNNYRPLTTYWIEKDDQLADCRKEGDDCLMFCGELELPITVGTAGGVINTNPVYLYNMGIMGNPNAKELSMIMVCIGLAQNFAALRALATEGIQRGHMKLHATNIAFAALRCYEDETNSSRPSHDIMSVARRMIEKGSITLTTAKELIEESLPKSQISQCTHM
ncbi:1266_t:CDS:2 [Gigaspora margarita]|uniref:3-hydroxy-3-methylglutaryl coenzyme A reductase n=1 Tax=Gigaspora margarita TaxID=4874 RepID=A0ABN7VHD1_GIGMA|nr:1266_t:CDS:2 [Gigaspora margarita]